jgi:nucleotide-binding universal stress UspA family protein
LRAAWVVGTVDAWTRAGPGWRRGRRGWRALRATRCAGAWDDVLPDRVCAVDGSPAGFVALRQAMLLRDARSHLVAVTVCDVPSNARAGPSAAAVNAQARDRAGAVRDAGMREMGAIPFSDARVIEGRPAPSLLAVIRHESATVIAVGAHRRGPIAGVPLGSIATAILHRAPCSVFVARPARESPWCPRRIVVGMDGSPQALASAVAATELADRFGAEVRSIAARGGGPVDRDRLHGVDGVEWVPGHPVGALVDASKDADLVIVGSRGLRAFEALGSVSERVARQARCSVLVVRSTAPRPGA